MEGGIYEPDKSRPRDRGAADNSTFSGQSNEVEADTRSLSSPSIIHAVRTNGWNETKWEQQADLVGVNVYRNDGYIGSVDFPDNVFNDTRGRRGDSYYSIGYDDFSRESTTEVVGGASVGRVEATIDQTGVVRLTWQTTPGHSYRLYRAVGGRDAILSGTKWKTTSVIGTRSTVVAADTNAKYGGVYGIEMVDGNGTIVGTRTGIRSADPSNGEGKLPG